MEKTTIIYIIAMVVIMFIFVSIVEIFDINCNKSQDICYIYTRTLLSEKKTDLDHPSFRISDIKGYEINRFKYTPGGRSIHKTHYYPVLYMKDRRSIYLHGFNFSKPEKVDEMIYRIIHDDNYVLKGSFFKALFNTY